MNHRFNMATVLPEAYKAVYQLSIVTGHTSLTPIQKELIKIRASQINGCAFCIDMHTKDALKAGESQQRIFLLNAWRETDLFSDLEKALLAVTEEVTLISNRGLTEETYRRVLEFFSEEQLAQIIMSVVTINAWNRIAVSTHLPVPR